MSNPFERPPGQPEKPKIVTCPSCAGRAKIQKVKSANAAMVKVK